MDTMRRRSSVAALVLTVAVQAVASELMLESALRLLAEDRIARFVEDAEDAYQVIDEETTTPKPTTPTTPTTPRGGLWSPPNYAIRKCEKQNELGFCRPCWVEFTRDDVNKALRATKWRTPANQESEWALLLPKIVRFTVCPGECGLHDPDMDRNFAPARSILLNLAHVNDTFIKPRCVPFYDHHSSRRQTLLFANDTSVLPYELRSVSKCMCAA